jgi:predicted AlkP superfamily pyrophosphatase or phosphodiesterase
MCSLGVHALSPLAKPSHPKLVVVLVVDQMRADYVTNFHGQWTAGLARLVNQGAWFRNARYPYLNTVTCAGHATISTGRLPSVHGIIANAWYDRSEHEPVSCTGDPKATNIAYDSSTKGGDSAWRLEAPAFADELREQGAQPVRVASFSVKARAAIMLAGHKAEAVAWHDGQSGAWATSSAYGNSEAIAAYVKAHPVSADFGKAWTPVPPDEKFVFTVTPNGRQLIPGWHESFPHAIEGNNSSATSASFYTQWEESPYSSEYLVRMAEGAVDSLHLGQRQGTDFLGISFSSLDMVGHALGPYSHEVQDTLSQLDRQLGELFAYLDRTVGAGNYVVALSADHGVAPIPEEGATQGLNGGRVSDRAIEESAESVLDKEWGGSGHVADIVEGDSWLTPGDYQRLGAEPATMKEVLQAIMSIHGVAHLYRSEELAAHRETTDPVQRAAELGYYLGRSGDLVIALKPYWIYSDPHADGSPGNGTTHGSAYDYDQRVPLLLYGWGVRHGNYDRAASPLDIAPTLAELCGVHMPSTDGRVLKEAIHK